MRPKLSSHWVRHYLPTTSLYIISDVTRFDGTSFKAAKENKSIFITYTNLFSSPHSVAAQLIRNQSQTCVMFSSIFIPHYGKTRQWIWTTEYSASLCRLIIMCVFINLGTACGENKLIPFALMQLCGASTSVRWNKETLFLLYDNLGQLQCAASLCPNPCLSTRIAWNLFWDRDEINGTFYWCRSCLWCCGIVMKKNVEGMLRRWNIKMPPAGSRSAAEWEISPSWWKLDQNKSWLMGVWMCLHVCLLIEYVQHVHAHVRRHTYKCTHTSIWAYAKSHIVIQAFRHIYGKKQRSARFSLALNWFVKHFTSFSIFFLSQAKVLNWNLEVYFLLTLETKTRP